ncbi:hypothetical protein [Ureibacillus sp. FSL K6-2830]|uniref:hypothetical protein n=1 Tax=Ureibacillus sp. FSL K6-2830 TaxID=2954610 RepID=UPI0030F76AA2
MKIGARIYYEIETGNVIVNTGERQGSVVPTTVEQDIQTYKALSERNRDTFDYIELEYGQYAQDFAESNGYRVNPETKELEFSFPNPNEEEPQELVYQKPLSERLADSLVYQVDLDFRVTMLELGLF